MSSFGNSTASQEYRPLDNHYREVEDLSYALSLRLASSVGEALLKQDGKPQPKASPNKSPSPEKLDEPADSQDAALDSNATKEGDDDPVDADYQKYYDEVSSIIKANKALLDTIGGCLSEIASFHGIDEEEFDSMPSDAYEAGGDLLDSTAKEEDDSPTEVPSRDAQGLNEDEDDDDDGSLFSLFNDTPPEKTGEPTYADEVARLLYNISTLEEDGGPAEAISQQPKELDRYDGGPLSSLFNAVPPPNNDEESGEDPDTSSSTTTTDSDSDSDSDSTEIILQKDDPVDQEKFSRIIHALIDCELSKTEAYVHRRQAPPPASHLGEEEAQILESIAGPDAGPAEKEKLASSAEQVRQRLAARGIESIPEDTARARAAWLASAARRALVARRRRRRERLRAGEREEREEEEEEEKAARVRAGERMAMEVWGRALGGAADLCCGGRPYYCFEPALEGFRRIAEMGERAFAELEGRLLEGGRDLPSSSSGGWAKDV